MPTTEEIKMLFAEFPKDAVSWRSQSLTKTGDKAMALAYIDARDVMDRLDEICGSDGWQDRYEFSGPRTICYLSIKVGDEWITKADGAGDTAVEAEKGALSDAFKRAAVKWGIGRYLYGLDAPWVPCESYEKGGKLYWKRWTADPWSCVKGIAPSAHRMKAGLATLDTELLDCHSPVSIDQLSKAWGEKVKAEFWPAEFKTAVANKFTERRNHLQKEAA